MKQLAVILLAISFAVNSFAQEHMTFKGVEIDGTPEEMAQKLKEVGFKYDGFDRNAGIHYMTGKFAGYKAKIGIMSTDNLVHTVAASYTDGLRTWGDLLDRFNMLEDMLNHKYGNPISIEKEIDYTDDGRFSIRDGNGKWMTAWKTDKGRILLYIQVTKNWLQAVVIGYMDEANVQSSLSDTYNDL